MGKHSLSRFIRDQYAKPQPVTRKDLTGKTVIVLGANIGLGFEAAKHFATMKPGKLILACRNKAKGDEAVQLAFSEIDNAAGIKADTGCTTVELWIIDLADFASVKAFAEKFNNEESRLDILVANSAVGVFDYETTKDGWESTIQVNHLATSLTALLLLPKMLATAKEHNTTPRITIVSSDVHYWTELDDEVLKSDSILEKMSSKDYCTKKIMGRRYFDSKLFNVLFVRSLASHLPSPSPVIIDAVNPGYCYSAFRRNYSGAMLIVDRIMEFFLALPTEVGSRQLVYAALGGRDEEMNGSYISGFKITEESDFVIGPKGKETGDRLWSETIMTLSKVEPKVQEIVSQSLSA